MSGIFDNTIRLLGNVLDLRAERNRLLQSNIANEETPGYRAVDIDFAKELEKTQNMTAPGNVARTNPAHMPIISEMGAPHPHVFERPEDAGGYDNNSVGVESEMVKLSENTLDYDMATRMITNKFNLLMTAIKEGGR